MTTFINNDVRGTDTLQDFLGKSVTR